ncbi:hypothetical protein N7G274_008348 [Stereocaulon virgatum]|uniref:Zn(2)-C6 fungal-type domain-containing protein n=1 Tax=Stereocaulon virgatum TaxID=373712 RepID=A0ABR4A6P5_9LECA
MFTRDQHFNVSRGAVGDAEAPGFACTYEAPSNPSEDMTTTHTRPEEIDPLLPEVLSYMDGSGELRFQNDVVSRNRTKESGALDPSMDFQNQAMASLVPHTLSQQVSPALRAYVRPQETLTGGMNNFHWVDDGASLHQPQVNYSTFALSAPAPSLAYMPVNLHSMHYTHIQPAPFGSDSLDSWDPLHSSDYSSSQRTPGDFQNPYAIDETSQIQPHASFIPTRAVKVESSPDDFSNAMAPMASVKSYNSQRMTPNDGNVASEITSSAGPKTKTRKMTPEQRANAKMMRIIGNCIRCKIMKLSCDQGRPCRKCSAIVGKTRTYREPCFRENLDDASIVRQGNSEFDQDVMSFRDYQWNSTTETKSVRLNWILPGAYKSSLPELIIECQRYVPRPGDITAAQWQDRGRVTVLQLPTYACHDEAKLLGAVSNFLEAGRKVIAEEILDEVTDELDCLTFREAFRVAKKDKSSILLLALRIRANTILSAGCGTPIGEETLGIAEIVNAAAGHIGDRPLPPALDHQIDVAIWENIRKDQKSLIKQLKQKLFSQRGRKPWLEIFLTFFVSLSNVQYVHGRAMAWMNSQRGTDSAVMVTHRIKTMIERWNHSAMNILHHFRSIFRGDAPLVAAEKNLGDFVKRENLDPESMTYVKTILKILSDQGGSLLKQTMGSNIPKFTESGDHWTRQLFMHQYQGIN